VSIALNVVNQMENGLLPVTKTLPRWPTSRNWFRFSLVRGGYEERRCLGMDHGECIGVLTFRNLLPAGTLWGSKGVIGVTLLLSKGPKWATGEPRIFSEEPQVYSGLPRPYR